MKVIDYEKIIEEGELFTDPHWPVEEAILDPLMMRKPRIQMWETLVWKRPSEVYGEGNYTMFDNIDPNDIL